MSECNHEWIKWSWQATGYLKGELVATIWEARYCSFCKKIEIRLAYKKGIYEEKFIPTRKHFRQYSMK